MNHAIDRITRGTAALAVVASGLLWAGIEPAGADVGCPTAAGGFGGAGANGTSVPYEIDSPSELQLLKDDSTYWDDSFILTGNVSMAGCTWTSTIGDTTRDYVGSFDGDGFTISNVTVTVSGDYSANPSAGIAGLFGAIGPGSQIADLNVSGQVTADISGANAYATAGGLVAQGDSATITGSSFTGSVTAKATGNHPVAGGILGSGTDVVISAARVRANVAATDVGRAAAGGVAGVLNSRAPGQSVISQSWVVGSIVSRSPVQASSGGIAGWTGRITVTQSFADATVTSRQGSEPAAGGIIGGGGAKLVDTYAKATITSDRMAGGLVGWSIQDDSTANPLENSYFTGTLSNGGNQALGGLVGRSDYLSTEDFQAPGSVWNQQVSGVADAAGYGEYVNGGTTLNPVVFGAQAGTTADMTTQSTYTGLGWSIDNTFPTGSTWSLCANYNDGYPYLPILFSTSPCTAPAAASVTPSTQTMTGVVGSNISTTPLNVTGFTNPFFSVSPSLPSGLSLNPLTGVVSGTVQDRVGSDQAYTVTAWSANLPLQKATATITQTATPLPPMNPGQISTFTLDQSSDGQWQAVTTRPSDGYGLAIAYANYTTASGTDDTYYAFLLDADGEVVGGAIPFMDGSVNIAIWGSPAVAYNPVTGGWLVCYSSVNGNNSVPMCQYLNANGTPNGAAFPVAPGWATDPYNQNSIAFDAGTGKFLVASTAWTVGVVLRFVNADGTGVSGTPIDVTTHVTTALSLQGGVDIAFSPTSNTYLLAVRGRQSGSHKFAPWAYHLNRDGIPMGEPVRFTPTTSEDVSNGSIAYNEASDEFMMVAMSLDGPKPLGAVRFNAATGQPIGAAVWTDFGAPFTQPPASITRYRPAIAANPEDGDFLVSVPITLASASNKLLYYVVPMASDGTGGAPIYVAGTSAEVVGPRPRIAFNAKTCEFLTTYQQDSTSWGWQLFGVTIPALRSCGNPTPTPNPTPGDPPAAPLGATATAGNAEAIVTWEAPRSSGTFAVTSYHVTASPGGRSCLATAPARTCTVTGLTNGTSYTFRVRALNGAGWSAYSQPSNVVTPSRTPEKAIVITGSRGADGADRRVTVSGTTVDMVGAVVTPFFRFRGESSFRQGSTTRTIDADGAFTWSRKTGKKIHIYFEGGGVRSNRIVIAAR